MAKFNPKSYAKNVMRSAGYIGVETIKGVNPSLTSFISDSSSTIKDMYSTAKELRRGDTTILKKIFGDNEELLKNVEKTKHNILDDIRTGKFYNPEREKKSIDAYMKNEMGFDFNFDDMDFDIDENYGEDKSSSSGDGFGSLSKVQQMVTAASTDEITRNASKNTSTSISANAKLFGQVNNSLTIINSSILAFHQDLATPLNNHIINSSNFYQAATEQLANQTAILEHMNNILSERFEPKKNGFGNSSTSTWDEVMGDGLPNLSNLASHAKKAIKSSDLGLMGSMFGPDMISMLAEAGGLDSPIALIASMALTSKLQNGPTGRSMNRLNSTLKGGFGNIASKIHNYNKSSWTKDKYGNIKSKNGALSYLAKIFDITPEAQNKIDTSRYNKGRADWTGIDNKALTEVIPTQLAKIYSAITGKEAEIYDYKSGRWIKAGNIKKEFDKAKNDAIGRADTDFRDSALKNYIDYNNDRGANINYRSRSTISFKNDYNKVMQHFVLNNTNVGSMTDNQIGAFLATLARQGIIDKRNVGHIKRVFAGERKSLASNAVNSGRSSYNKFMESAGNDQNFSMLANNSNLYSSGKNSKDGYKSTLLGIADDKGNDIFFYLQSYYTQLESIKYNIANGNFRGNRGQKANQAAGIPAKFEVPNNAKTRHGFANIDNSDPGRVTIQNERDTYNEETGEWESGGKKRQATSKHDLTAANKDADSSPLSRMIDRVTNTVSNIFIGNTPIQSAIKEEGILGALKRMPNLIGESVADAFKKIQEGILNWGEKMLTKFKESNFGKDMIEEGKSTLKGFGKGLINHAVKSAGNVAEWATGKRPNWAGEVTDIPQAYTGGYVNKSGMVSVSEGEMIIPSEQNPFYTGRTNKSSQKAKESMNYRNWVASGSKGGEYWGNFSNGGKAKNKNKKKHRIRNAAANYTKNKVIDTATDIANQAVETGNNTAQNIKEYIDNSAAGPMIQSTVTYLRDSIDNSLKVLLGNNYNNAKDLTQEATKTIKDNAPKVATKGLMGAVVGGAMTGSGLGLLGGLAIGAGIEVVNNSDKISEFLFGNPDGTKSGVLPANVTNFIKKQLPDIAKSGALGSILGAIGVAPGGLMGGFALGAGVQMLANNDWIRDKAAQALFGNKDINGERHGGIIGSLKTRVVDPMSDFVQDGLGKIGGYLKDNFLAPLTKIFDPVKDWVKGKATKFIEGIGHSITSAAKGIFKNIGEIFDSTFGRLFAPIGKAAKGLLKGIGNIASLPFKAVGAAGDKLEKHNIKKGYSSRNARERVEILGEEKSSGYNKTLAQYTDENGNVSAEGQQYIKDVNFFSNGKGQAKNVINTEREDAINTAVASLTNGGMGNPDLVKKLRNALNSKESRQTGNFSKEALDLINGLDEKDMSADKKQKVIESLTNTGNSLQQKISDLKAYDAKQLEFFKNHDELGAYNPLTGQVNNRALKEFNMQARTDMDILKGTYADNFKKSQEEHIGNLSDAKKQELAEQSDILGKQRNATLNSILDVVQLLARKAGVDVPEKNRKFGNILANGQSSDEVGEDTRTDSDTDIDEASNSLQNTISKLTGSGSGNEVAKSDEEKGYRFTHDSDGNTIKEVYISGRWQKDMTDSSTSEVVNEKKKESALKSKFFTLFTSGAFFTGIKGLFGGNNKDEKKTSLWDKLKSGASKLFETFFGDASNIGSFIKSIVSGGGLGSLIQSALSSAISYALPSVLVGLGIKGLINASEENAGTEYDSEMKGADYDEDGGEERQQEAIEKENKRNIFQKIFHGGESLEYKIRGKNMRTYKEDDYVTDTYAERTRDKIIQNAAGTIAGVEGLTNATKWATQHGGVAGKVVAMVTNPAGIAKSAIDKVTPIVTTAGNNVYKAGSSIASTASKAWNATGGKVIDFASAGSEALSQGLGSEMSIGQKVAGKVYGKVSSVTSKAADVTSNVVSTLASSIKNILTKVADKLGISIPEDAGEGIASTIMSNAKEGATKLKSAVQAGAKIFYWANVINAITYGAQSAGAKEILGILDEPTLMQRALAAICNGINAAIPLIGGIIPTRTLVTIVYKVLSALGIDFGNFENQRAVAESTVDDYNTANGTTYDLKEYLYNVRGEATIQTRVSHTVSVGVDKIKNGIKNFGTNIKETAGKVVDSAKTTASNALSTAKNFVSNSASTAKDFVSNLPSTISTFGTTLGNGVKSAISGITNAGQALANIVDNSKSTMEPFSKKGDIKGLWAADSDTESDGTAFGWVSAISDAITKYAYTPDTFGNMIGKSISDLFTNVKSSTPNISDYIKKAWKYATDTSKNMNTFDSLTKKYKVSGSGALATIGNSLLSATSFILKTVISVVKPILSAASTIGNTVGGAVNTAGNVISNIGTTVKNWLTGGASGIHVTQKGSYQKFGNSNLDQNGCGPATAATVLRAYGKNANLDSAADYAKAKGYVAGASGVGTKAGYFGDILGANGINTSYTTSKKNISKAVGSGNPTVLLGQDKSNHSKSNSPFGPNPHYVVTRGSDSKGNIVVDDPELGGTALYKKNILKNAKLGIMTGGASGLGLSLLSPIKRDVASSSASKLVTNKSNTTTDTSSTSVLSSSNTTSTSSSGNKASNNAEAIWGYYKKLGLSDDATAGIIGNIHAESGETLNPKVVEGGLINHLKGKSYSGKDDSKWQKAGNIYKDAGVDLTSKQTVYDTYTAAVDNGKISSDEFQNPYKKLNDANYKSDKAKTGHEWLQFGYGLTQFTSPSLKKELYDATVSQGKSIGDLGAQLDVLTNQLNSCGVLGTLRSSGVSYSKAAEEMLTKYEKPANAASQISKRAGYAKQYYDQYKGKTFDIDGYISSSGTTFSNVASSTNDAGAANTAAATSSTTGTGLSGALSSFFSNMFSSASNSLTGKGKSILSLIFGGFGSSSSSTDSSATNSSLTNDSSISTTVSGDTSPSYNGVAKAVPTDAYGKGTPEAMVKIAQSQLGVVEGNDNITDYGKFTGTDGAAWCAAFVSWVMDQTFGGDKTKRNKAMRGGISAAVSNLWSNFKNANAMTDSPQPGDVVIFKKNGSHTGIVETVNGKQITTIEGNTGTDNTYERNGGGVARHSFTIGDGSTLDARLTGFGRPDWSGSGSGLPVYNFTGKDVAYASYKGGASGTDTTDTSTPKTASSTLANTLTNTGSINTVSASDLSGMSTDKKVEQILLYLKQLVSNTGYNVSIPEIVDVLKSQADIISNLNSGTTVVNNSGTSASTQDTQNQINTDISKMMAKLDAISQTL